MSVESPTLESVAALAEAAAGQVRAAGSAEQLEKLRVQFLGKQGEISTLLRSLGKLPEEQRPAFGQAVNAAKNLVQEAIDARKAELQAAGAGARPKSWIDVTLPGVRREVGRPHPLMRTMEELKGILLGMGFRFDDYPEIETEYHNFDGLNTPSWHPSRDLHDSFYTAQSRVMRTHTSAFQVHAMKAFGPPPLRAMTAGRCYRRDEIDDKHFPIFHQLDAIAIGRTTSFADLKHTLFTLLTTFLGSDIQLRFRPSYFPFTTPSAEVDVLYRGRWMELLGSGMMRPEVLRNGGIDPEQWRGFAFGMGIDRITMAKYNIEDIRSLYENEAAFLTQF